MSSTDGLKRGTEAKDTGAAIKVPVGPNTTGRLFDLLGNPLEKGVAHPGTGETLGDVDAADYWPIHRPAPNFADQQAISEVFETGIKVVDLLCPFAKGGKIGLFGGAGVGKTVIIQEMIARVTASSSAATPSSAASASAPARATTSGSRWPRPSTPTPDGKTAHVLDKVAMVFGQMNEPPGARLRVALSGLTMAEYFRDVRQGNDDLRRQHLPLHPGRFGSLRAARPYAVRGGLPADALDRDGRAPGAHHLDAKGAITSCRPSTCPRTT
jgi:F-type H+-transporting ATPase subunit beta